MTNGPERTLPPSRSPIITVYAALLIAVLAISSSALLVRWADASPIALAFWRTLAGAMILAVPARRARWQRTTGHWPYLLAAGLALGLHFSSWLASLELTSVAASVTLVSVAPLFIAIFLAASGRRPGGRTWFAVVMALLGTLVIAAGDIGTGRDALTGDGLAVIGAAALAIYFVVGDRLRSELPTSVYASRVYLLAAVSLVPVVALFRVPLWGYDRTTWLAIIGMILGPQLAGHTLLNMLLKPLGSLTVSLALLAEPVGATLLVWVALGEVPPVGAVVGAPLVIAGLGLHLLTTSARANNQPVTS